MNRREFLRKLLKTYGIALIFVRGAKGSHEWWEHKASGKRFLIPHKLAHRNMKNALTDVVRRIKVSPV